MTRRMALIGTMTMLVSGAITGTADARGVSALTGRAAVGSEIACFGINVSNGWVVNGCSVAKLFEIGLDTDTNSSKTINVEVKASNTNNTFCRSVAIKRDGTGASVSSVIHPSVAGTPTNLLLTGSTTVSQGLLYVDCTIDSGDSIMQVDYNS